MAEKALTTQVGGSHYKNMAIQPIEYCQKNGLGYCESNVVKYVSRWKNKNGVEDLMKARHCLDLLIEMQTLKEQLVGASSFEKKIAGDWRITPFNGTPNINPIK